MSKETKPFSIKDRIRSFGFAFQGFAHLFKTEHNAWLHLSVSVVVIGVGVWFSLSATEWIVIILCIGMVFVAEIFIVVIKNVSSLWGFKELFDRHPPESVYVNNR